MSWYIILLYYLIFGVLPLYIAAFMAGEPISWHRKLGFLVWPAVTLWWGVVWLWKRYGP